MTPAWNAALRSWSIPPAPTFLLLICALTYLRGWGLLWRTGFRLISPWRAGAFLAGLLALFIALASPMDVFNGFVLTAHMLQHMTLMMVAPPLLLLGNPLLPILRGMPRFAAREYAGPLLRWVPAQRLAGFMIHPITALVLMGIVNFSWHTPRLYDLALRSDAWHQTEHACFLLAALVFWWPVVQPWPSKTYWPRWAMVPYLVVADLQNTVLSAILVFSDRLLYPYYEQAPNVFGLNPQQDQAAAGAIMWVVGSLAYLIPAVMIAVQCLSRRASTIPVGQGSDIANHLRVSGATSISDKGSRRLWTLSSRRAQAASFVIVYLAIGLTWVWLAAHGRDEDLQLFAQRRSAQFEVYVFDAADASSVGYVTIAVLVQDSQTGGLLNDAEVALSLAGEGTVVDAEPDKTDNKLLQSAVIQVRSQANAQLQIWVRTPTASGVFLLPFTASMDQPHQGNQWPYYAFAVLTLGLGVASLCRTFRA